MNGIQEVVGSIPIGSTLYLAARGVTLRDIDRGAFRQFLNDINPYRILGANNVIEALQGIQLPRHEP